VTGERLIVTIDGPAGTGKSTVGRALARRLGLEFLDTGAMYRGATAVVLDEGVDASDERAVARAVRRAAMRFDWTTDPPTLLAHGRPMTDRLREPDVAAVISTLAAQAPLREALVAQQRAIARSHPRLVTEGRDQGSVVFPDAAVKFYLTASPRIRARRRAEQLRAAGRPADVDEIERDLARRDRLDAARAVGPLVKPPGAVEVDTSEMTFDEVIDALERLTRQRAPAGALAGARGG